MTADSNNQDTDEQVTVPDPPQLRKVSEEELKRVLAEHKKWVESRSKEGSKADLKNTDLRGAKLEGANLQIADLRRAGRHERHTYRSTRNVGKLLGEAGKVRARFAVILGDELADGNVAL